MAKICTLFPGFNNGQGVSYSCRWVCEYLQDESTQLETWFPSSDNHVRPSFVRHAYPRWMMPVIYRMPEPGTRMAKAVERAFLKALGPDDIAYLWPGISIDTYKRIKDRGNVIVVERINCHTQYAKKLLDAEYDRIGWPISHGITEMDVIVEQKQMELADFVYAPNPFVIRSLQEAGVPDEKILPASYGWDPQRMKGTSQLRKKENGLTVVFVGRLCVRKGIHLLLEAWGKADIDGHLLFAGAVHHDIAERLAGPLARADVVQLGHTLDVGSVYRSADVFVFGSLEEGGPMVTYEAMGCGLPVITSPMGAGPTRDGIDGFVIDPHDIEGWAAAFRRFADDAELRKQMGHAALERAADFTWERVGERRREALMTAIDSSTRQAVAV